MKKERFKKVLKAFKKRSFYVFIFCNLFATFLHFACNITTAPYEVLIALGKDIADEEEEFVHYLENISSEVSFKKWYFGHLHLDEEVDDYICLYDKIIEIE